MKLMPWIADELVFPLSCCFVFLLKDRTCNQSQRLMDSSSHSQT